MLINVHCSCHTCCTNKYQTKAEGETHLPTRKWKFHLVRKSDTVCRHICNTRSHHSVSRGSVPTCKKHLVWLFQAFLKLTQFNCSGIDKTLSPAALPAPLKSSAVISGHDIMQSALGRTSSYDWFQNKPTVEAGYKINIFSLHTLNRCTCPAWWMVITDSFQPWYRSYLGWTVYIDAHIPFTNNLVYIYTQYWVCCHGNRLHRPQNHH